MLAGTNTVCQFARVVQCVTMGLLEALILKAFALLCNHGNSTGENGRKFIGDTFLFPLKVSAILNHGSMTEWSRATL